MADKPVRGLGDSLPPWQRMLLQAAGVAFLMFWGFLLLVLLFK